MTIQDYQEITAICKKPAHHAQPEYFQCAVKYCQNMELEKTSPTLFDLINLQAVKA
jgi:hypothetical protein